MSIIDRLIQNVSGHAAVNNKFYSIWQEQSLSLNQIMIFTQNFYAWTYRFPEVLAAIIFSTDDPIIRAEYTKTLYSEMGHGNPNRIHSVLFRTFARDLITRLGGDPERLADYPGDNADVLPETHELNDWERSTYSSNLVAACGAQLAIEWQAYTMIRKLYEGARNYSGLWPNDDSFHEAVEFFYSHLGEAEKEHKEESYKASEKLLNSETNVVEFERGFNEHLVKIANFWNAVAARIEQEK